MLTNGAVLPWAFLLLYRTQYPHLKSVATGALVSYPHPSCGEYLLTLITHALRGGTYC
ncbi:hypothetical protein AGABI1DRAFT_116108 [Agaricus bisporus var. burnettii JB137-S8]|uniref:Uncharacterized protein n=1 Tax=Agaricus bisporus var. burnettii (strain JB137-S8 / ATCC MYA-4627 / FGSC 10392) TaxID=597362 RepID=K5WKR0_AGABU|nr:hypothetical protein AGABI2DRAFT_194993 [Agaricus bisporus var. bisporus H97]XP_007333457.1 uncharacterized protein AGABI1DRAFT_116108 [Agaricus bisporus var. burnettii JB137-S8]EKM75891.1 hypothetical protein AGABI1DRAFT_116108 [Agaricus bisporus var. burnettii JB137-S8]EKV44213.1 hypothetical protein AGABI2DRAFT_194993 [Agaricus bisporus var. bisporus H97]